MKEKGKSRRKFLQNAIAVSGGVATVGMVGNTPTLAQSNTSAQEAISKTADIVIAGGGLAGVCAAVAAVQAGASVILIEASKETGGTGLLSSGNVHSQGALDWSAMQKIMPHVDPYYGKTHMAKYIETIEWLRKTGAFNLTQAAPGGQAAAGTRQGAAPATGSGGAPPQGPRGGGRSPYGVSLNLGRGYEGKRQTFDHLTGLILKNGEIILNTRFSDLIANTAGRVTGIKATQQNGSLLTVNAQRAVILATGGFGCNKEMVTKYFGPQADLSVQRTVPYNDASGILAAQKLGAMLSRGMSGFYGHMQPFPPLLPQTPEEYEAFDRSLFNSIGGSLQRFTTWSLIVNQDGMRFVDESIGDELVIQSVLRQRHAICWVIMDSKIADPNRLKTLQSNKAVVLTGNTIEDLVGKIAGYGVDAVHLEQTVAEYNKAVQEKAGPRLTPARGGSPGPILAAPFYGIQATGGISATYGGLLINDKGQVLGGGKRPIPGLFAAPHTAGGIFYETYGGSLGCCAVWGRIAGVNAAAEPTA